jgi:hypothetical protein
MKRAINIGATSVLSKCRVKIVVVGISKKMGSYATIVSQTN